MTGIPSSFPSNGPSAVAPASPSVATVAASGAAGQAAVSQILDAATARLVEVVVTGAPAIGQVTVEGATGSLTLQLAMPVPVGATLSLRLMSLTPLPQFRVMAVDGQPVNQAGQPASGIGTGTFPGTGVPDQPPAVAMPEEPVPAPRGVPAMLVGPRDVGTALPAGSTFLVRIVSAQRPDPPDGVVPGGMVTTGGPTVEPDAVVRPVIPAGMTAAPLGQSVSPSPGPLAVVPDAPPGPALPAATPVEESAVDLADPAGRMAMPVDLPDSLDGVATSASRPTRPQLLTSLGLLTLDAAIDLPPGTKVVLEPVGPARPPVSPPPPESGEPARAWSDAFKAVLEAIHQADPRLALDLARRLPQVGPRLAVQLIQMTSAIQGGQFRRLLDEETLTALEDHRDLLDRLDEGLPEMKVPTRLGNDGGWLSFLLPVVVGGQIEPIRLSLRRPPEDDKEEAARDKDGARFLIDVELSRLGVLQLDGLVRRESKRFDLIVRSVQALPDRMRRDIAAIFADSLDSLGLSGGTSFQHGRQFAGLVRRDVVGARLSI